MPDTKSPELDVLLGRMAELGASDLFLTAGLPPTVFVNRKCVRLDAAPLRGEDLARLLGPLLGDPRAAGFETKPDFDLAYALPGKGRYRLNIFRQRTELGLVARRVKLEIQSFESLGLPPILATLALAPRGLLFVTGATGSGKSTTLASMIDHRNATQDGHIVTIEDPIEFIHPHRRSIVTQREVGVDTATFHDALKSALRQAPDAILIGEVRDRETAEAALHLAETGHLVLATLHSTNASQTLERLLNLFPQDLHAQIRMLLSLSLVGIVSQRLVASSDGKARLPAIEVLLPTPRVKDLIKQGDLGGIKGALAQGGDGMQSFDESLYRLVRAGKLAREVALAYSDSPNDFRLRFLLDEKSAPGREEPLRMGLR